MCEYRFKVHKIDQSPETRILCEIAKKDKISYSDLLRIKVSNKTLLACLKRMIWYNLVKLEKEKVVDKGRPPTYFTLTPFGLLLALAVVQDPSTFEFDPKYNNMLPYVLGKKEFFKEHGQIDLFKKRLEAALLREFSLLEDLLNNLFTPSPVENLPLDPHKTFKVIKSFFQQISETDNPFQKMVELEKAIKEIEVASDESCKAVLDRLQYNFYFTIEDPDEASKLWSLCKKDSELKAYIQQQMAHLEEKCRLMLDNIRAWQKFMQS